MDKNGLISIGKITGVHGVRGIVKVISYMESLSVFETGTSVTIKFPNGKQRLVEIEDVTPYKQGLLMAIKGITTRNLADELRDGEFFIERRHLPEPEEGSYYWADLIGLSVFSTDERYLGKLESIFPTGSNDVYVVKNQEEEILIPAIESVIATINLEQGMMRVCLPEGLLN